MRSNARVFALALMLSCGMASETVGSPLPTPTGTYGRYEDTGLASWYGEELLGNRTASGDRFDPAAMTAAHRTLPLGSFVEVTSLETGRSILVRINDRGPGRRDRMIDLSRAAARLLGTDRRQVVAVRIRTIVPTLLDATLLRAGKAAAPRMPTLTRIAAVDPLPARRTLPPFEAGHLYILQVATFSNHPRATALAGRLGATVTARGGLYRVRLGPFADVSSLQRVRDAVAERGYGDAQVLPTD
ncbi:septal ring lytic transglycosylase RlpA family protein [Sphingomonas faeni]|uniref:septal ring lytic transglycosylase RlpA family protein n=1 Tax=Sphingomonas faeni TaxID=185950 RepID=UPI003344FD45